MKKIIALLLLAFQIQAQIKVKDLPTTTGGSTSDYLIKDDAAGISGSTKKISVANFLATYYSSGITGSGTINFIPKFTSSGAIGNSFVFFSGNNVVVPTGKFISGTNTNKARIDFSYSGSDLFLITPDGGRLTHSYFLMDTLHSQIATYYLGGGASNDLKIDSTKVLIEGRLAQISAPLKYTGASPTNGYILTSDASGNATWNAPAATGVTSVATSYGLSGGTITSTGTLKVDTTSGTGSAKVATQYYVSTHSGTGTVTGVSGTTNRITSTGGTTPAIDISSTFEALLGKVASPLSQFASTTSSQLAGVISDETGSGALVFGTSPTLSTAVLGSSTATTQSASDNSTKVATTAYVDRQVALVAGQIVITSPAGVITVFNQASNGDAARGTALMAAFAACGATYSISIGPGNYLITSAITILDRMSIKLNGTKIYSNTNTNNVFVANGVDNWALRGPGIVQGSNSASGTPTEVGLLITTCQGYFVDGIRFRYFKNKGIQLKGVADGHRLTAQMSNIVLDSNKVGLQDSVRAEYNEFINLSANFNDTALSIYGGNNMYANASITDNIVWGIVVHGGSNNGHGSFVGGNCNHNANSIWLNNNTSVELFTGLSIFSTNSTDGFIKFSGTGSARFTSGTLAAPVSASGTLSNLSIFQDVSIKTNASISVTTPQRAFIKFYNCNDDAGVWATNDPFPIADGGTNSTSFATGINFYRGGKITNNDTLAWNGATKTLQVGTISPAFNAKGITISNPSDIGQIHILNNNTSSFSSLNIANADFSHSIRFQYYGSAFSTSGMQIAATANLMAVGMPFNMGCFSAQPLGFWTNNTQRGVILSTGEFGIGGVTTPTALVHIGANSASLAAVKISGGGVVTTTATSGMMEYDNEWYLTKGGNVRFAQGGALADFFTDVNNSGTGETDLYTYTTPANTIEANGGKLTFDLSGTFNDLTATGQLQMYFAGTNIGNTGALTISATGAWSATGMIIRTGASTARAVIRISTPGASTATYTSETDITGITFSNTNILKITGTAGGASGGSSDITAKLGSIYWYGLAHN